MSQYNPRTPYNDVALARSMVSQYGSPLYVYDTEDIGNRADQLMEFEMPYGLIVRYAVKANPHPEIISLLSERGLQFDASSSYEAVRILEQGIDGSKISLSSQQPAHDLEMILERGVRFIATSLRQLELFIDCENHTNVVGLRINPGMGLGHIKRFTTGGPSASFGLWHEYAQQALDLAQSNGIIVDRLQVHVGTGGDPSKWGEIMDAALEITEKMPDVTSLDLGGGYKIAYTDSDTAADMPKITGIFKEKLVDFENRTGRKLQLEIEPGRWMVASSGYLLTEIVDIVDTGPDGYTFLRTNTGMNDFMRPAMYGAQHRIRVLSDSVEQAEYIVVGHNCETSDVLTPAPHDPEGILVRTLNKANIGDLLAIADTGAYCASMSAKGYNAFPDAREILI